jgi:hypothetical protein
MQVDARSWKSAEQWFLFSTSLLFPAMNTRKLFFCCCFLLSWIATEGYGHGGVSMEDDTCILTIGPYRAHFTGYQPQVRASQEFCEDIPVVSSAIIVLDYLDLPLRRFDIDFRVVNDVNGIGVNGTYEQLGGPEAIANATIFWEPPRSYPNGSSNVRMEFGEAGAFVGIVTAREPGGEEQYVAIFPFSVGIKNWYDEWFWLIGLLFFGAVLYVWIRKPHATAP